MAVLILLLVSSVIAAGIPAATSAYKNAVDGANARTLLSTTVDALRSELSTAWDVKVGTNEIYYYSARTGAKTRLYNDSGTIKVQDYVRYDDNSTAQINPSDSNPVAPRDLVSEAMRIKTKNSSEKFNLAFTSTPPAAGAEPELITLTTVSVKNGTVDYVSLSPLTIRLIDSNLRVPELP